MPSNSNSSNSSISDLSSERSLLHTDDGSAIVLEKRGGESQMGRETEKGVEGVATITAKSEDVKEASREMAYLSSSKL